MDKNVNDVRAELFYYVNIVITKCLMVAERMHRLRVHQHRARPYHKVQQQQADGAELYFLATTRSTEHYL
eukprot:1099947-Amphidinium_carterae.1